MQFPKDAYISKQSYSPSSILPAYSPPSFPPTVLDIKRESSSSAATTTRQPRSQYDELYSFTINEKDAELGLDTPVPPSESRFSWQTIFVPLSIGSQPTPRSHNFLIENHLPSINNPFES